MLVEGARLFGDEEENKNRPGRFDENDGKEMIAALKGRYGKVRVTNFSRQVYKPSRPVISGKTSFHFAQTVVTKIRKMAGSPKMRPGDAMVYPSGKGATAAIKAAGGRIHRGTGFGIMPAEAAKRHPELTAKYSSGEARYAFIGSRNRHAAPAKAASVFQRYCERGGDSQENNDGQDEAGDASEALPAGAMKRIKDLSRDDGGIIEITSIGKTSAERTAFWDAVDEAEQSGGRIQYRIIAEIPHEVSLDLVRQALEEFTDQMRSRNLPFYAVVHESEVGAGSDPRNRHCHFLYYDRPCHRSDDGGWDFSGSKHPDTRKATWIPLLRSEWSAAFNRALDLEEKRRRESGKTEMLFPRDGTGCVAHTPGAVDETLMMPAVLDPEHGNRPILRRLDPRTYKEMGIPKYPCLHMGPKATRLERMGVPTTIGVDNARLEEHWKVYLEAAWRQSHFVKRIKKGLDLIKESPDDDPFANDDARSASLDLFLATKEHCTAVIRYRETDADNRVEERADRRFDWAEQRKQSLEQEVEKRRAAGRVAKKDGHRLGLINLLSEIQVDAKAAKERFVKELVDDFDSRGIDGPHNLLRPLQASRKKVEDAATSFQKVLLGAEIAKRQGHLDTIRELSRAVAFDKIIRSPEGTVDQLVADARRLGPSSGEGKTSLIMADVISHTEQRAEAEARKAAALDRLFEQMAVSASERPLWQSTLCNLAGTTALRAKLPNAPVFRTGPEPDLEREQLAEIILSERSLRPQRFDRAFEEPRITALSEAVEAITIYRLTLMNEVEKADVANSWRQGCIGYGRSDEVRPIIEAAQRRIDELQRQYDGLSDPMAASRVQREQERAARMAATRAEGDFERLALEQQEKEKARREAEAKRERRRQFEM